MSARSSRSVPFAVFAIAAFAFGAAAVQAKEMKGAAILAHPCGKVAVEHMGLVHDGKMEEATKLGTKALREEWAAMPKEDREMMTGMMKEMSLSRDEMKKAIEAGGTLAIEGKAGTLTIVKETKDENGTSTETTTQTYELDGDVCRIARG